MDALDPNHPRHKLAFYVSGSVDLEGLEAVAEFVKRLGASRTRLLSPPEYFDIHEVPEDDSHAACCMDDVGGFIEIYSTWPPWTVPQNIDRQQFGEAAALLDALEEFSAKQGLDFEIHFADEVIGYAIGGKMEGVREMLLDGWADSLGTS